MNKIQLKNGIEKTKRSINNYYITQGKIIHNKITNGVISLFWTTKSKIAKGNIGQSENTHCRSIPRKSVYLVNG